MTLIDPARMHRLEAAAVGLLEALIGDRAGLPGRLATLAEVARDAGLETLADRVERLRPGIDARAVDVDELQSVLIAIVDFCAGRIDADTLQVLSSELQGDVPPADDRPGNDPLAGDRVVARDELALLADEARAMGDELAAVSGVPVASGQTGRLPGEPRSGDPDPASMLGEGLVRLADAAAAIGLGTTASLLELRAAQLCAGHAPDGGAPVPIDELPEALAVLFESAGTDRRALALLFDAGWPEDGIAIAPELVHEEFDTLSLVDSRQVTLDASDEADVDFSLTIPPDADPDVLDSLLRELPALSGVLGERIAAFAAGDASALADAQRLAHTLKGSANTVGLRGVAAITHRLEDLLQLIAGRPFFESAELHGLLGDAADCVAEMCEAVAIAGDAPAGAESVHAGLLAAIRGLLGDSGAVAGAARVARAAPGQDPAERPVLGGPADGFAVTGHAAGEGDGSATAADAQPRSAAAGDGEIRVPAAVVERLLALVDEASIVVAQAREQVAGIGRTRATLGVGGDQLQDLAGELERLVDLRGMALDEHRSRHSLDPLELDEYGELHTVSRRIAESGADGKLIERQLGADLSGLGESLARLERLQADLRDCALRTRMAAFGSIGPRLQRTVRQAARMAGREAELVIDGAETLVDAGMLAALVDPLAHLLRNAVDHGIEPSAERSALGKPVTGMLRLMVRRDGATLTLSCADDGRGLDATAIAERARAQGLLADDAGVLAPARMRALIMAPGFSTRAQASQLSGRGIGLDVVRQAVDRLGGTIDVESTPGKGTCFTLEVPLGLASLPVMLMRASRQALALALSVRGIERIVPADASPADTDGRIVARLESLLGLDDDAFEPDALAGAPDAPAAAVRRVALLVELPGAGPAALLVPEPEPPRSVVVRPMPAHLPRLPGFDGIVVLGDGAVATVLDPVPLLSAHVDGRLRPAARPAAFRAPVPAGPLCLVVDDSVSVRRTTENFVRDLGFEVEGAGDGIEALERVRRRVPDLMLVDMEMPRMNGLDLVRALRADPRTEEVAVVMITSRYSERHKMLALDAGVDVYLTKPYTEDALASQIQACFAVSRKARMG